MGIRHDGQQGSGMKNITYFGAGGAGGRGLISRNFEGEGDPPC